MPAIRQLTDWGTAHQAAAILIVSLFGLALIGVIVSQIIAGYRGRTLSARASIGFGIVQAGVAYVTITGVYQFWHARVGMPAIEAGFIAGFIEAVTWASVGMIFAHGADPATVGIGDAGNTFWSSIIGGGLMAIAGSPSFAVALGRIVVVSLGANMWWLRIRMKTRRRPRTAARWRLTPRQFAIARGWMTADDADIVHNPREVEIRQLTRAIGRKADGRGVARWFGTRTIRRVMESGDADMVRDAQGRYALQTILADDLKPDSASMRAAIDAARLVLYPPPPPVAPAAPPAPPQAPEPPPPPPAAPPRRRPASTGRTGAAAAARADSAAAMKQRAEAIERAVAVIIEDDGLVDGKPITGKVLGAAFGRGEEWGRLCLVEARQRVEADRKGIDDLLPQDA